MTGNSLVSRTVESMIVVGDEGVLVACLQPREFAASADVLAAWLSGKDAATVRAYMRDLETFRAFLGEASLNAFMACDVGSAHMIAHAYRGALLQQGLAPATINRKLAALRSLVTFGHMVGRIAWTLELPGVEARAFKDTRGPGADGFRAMVRALASSPGAKAKRDLAIIRLLFDRALRRAEVVSLDLEHYDAGAAVLHILGKKRREREAVSLPAPTRAALDGWLSARGKEPGPLFLNLDRARKGQRLTGRSIARLVADVAHAAGLGKVRPHGLRHAAITHALDATAGDVRKVARFSRHRDLRTLTIYDDNRTDLAGEVAALVAGED